VHRPAFWEVPKIFLGHFRAPITKFREMPRHTQHPPCARLCFVTKFFKNIRLLKPSPLKNHAKDRIWQDNPKVYNNTIRLLVVSTKETSARCYIRFHLLFINTLIINAIIFPFLLSKHVNKFVQMFFFYKITKGPNFYNCLRTQDS